MSYNLFQIILNHVIIFYQGVLRIHVVEASELKKADFKIVGKGKSDPYCKIYGVYII